MANKFFGKIFWSFNRHLFAYILKNKYNITYSDNCDPLPDSAFIMVSNHANFFDPWIVAHPSSRPVSIMMNEEGFKAKPITRWYLDKIGAFPKKKGASDIKSMKIALKRLADGSPLLVFPEGQTSWDGVTQPIFAGIEKLAIRSKLPLVMVHLEGNFISRPWWSSNDRKGKITISRKVIDSETVQKSSPDELRDTIINYIKNSDCKSKTTLTTNFVSTTPAEGLNRLLWLCPTCNKIETLDFKDNKVVCNNCSVDYTISSNLQVTTNDLKQSPINDIEDWVLVQKRFVLQELADDDKTLLLEEKGIELINTDYSGRAIVLDTGILKLNKEKLIYLGEHGTLEYEINKISQPVFQGKDSISFSYNRSDVMFRINGSSLYKWLQYLRYLTGYAEAEKRGYY